MILLGGAIFVVALVFRYMVALKRLNCWPMTPLTKTLEIMIVGLLVALFGLLIKLTYISHLSGT